MSGPPFKTKIIQLFRIRLPRWSTQKRGVAALEFAIAAPLLMLLIGAVMETGLLLFTQAILDNATSDASRLIRTGQLQQGGGAAAFASQLCADVGSIIPCASLQVNVQSAASFAALAGAGTAVADATGNLTPQNFNPGTQGQDVVVQVGYPRPYLIPWIGQIVSANGTGLLVSVAAFQNELY